MVTRLISGVLKGDALRNWLRTDGAGVFRAFESGVQAVDYLRGLGIGIRTQDFYAIRREVLSVQDSAIRVQDYPGDQLIPRAWHASDHGLNLTTDFQYRIELFGHDPNTGEIRHNYMTIASDRQLTQHQIQDAARNYIGQGGASGDLMLDAIGGIEPMIRS